MSSQASNLWNFNIFDFFVHLIPGVIGLIIIASHIPGGFSKIAEFDPLVVVGGAITIGYVLGQLIQELSRILEKRLLGRPKPFDEMLKSERGENSDNIKSRFVDQASDFFGLSIDWCCPSEDLWELFLLTRGYLVDVTNNRRVERFQALYLLFLSLYFLLGIASLSYIVHFVTLFNSGANTLELTLSGLTALFLGGAAVVSYSLRHTYHDRMARVLIYDFYSQVLSEHSREKPSLRSFINRLIG